MRFSTIVSLLIAIILATAAVYGAQNWLTTERMLAIQSLQQSQENPVKKEIETIVVANEPISFGERINSTTVREIEWSGAIRPEGSFSKIDELVVGLDDDSARFALTTMTIGEPILTSKVTDPGQRAKMSTALAPGKKAVSIRVNDVLGVSGFVLPGDRVDVLLSRDGFVDVLLQGLKVLAIDQTADERKDNPSVVRTVTFEVNTQEAQKLVLGANIGSLSLALRNLASTDIELNERITINDLNEFHATDDLLKAAAASDDTVETVPDPSLARLDELEKMLSDMSAGMASSLAGVEAKLDAPVPVSEVVKEVVVEKIVEVTPSPPVRATVAVIRNGQRNEYKVDRKGQDGVADPAQTGNEQEVTDVSVLQGSDS